MKILRSKKGFTLLEVLLVIAIIAVLAAIVIIAINPGKQMGESRNAQRRSDVNTILNAVYQYSIDNNGQVPTGITATATDVCLTTATVCTGLVDLTALTTNGTYLTAMPIDPSATGSSTGYQISRDTTTGRITVVAPSAEDTTITVTR